MSALMKEPEDEEDPDFLQETTRRARAEANMRVREVADRRVREAVRGADGAIMCFMLQIENVK